MRELFTGANLFEMMGATAKSNRNNNYNDEPMEEPPSAMLSLLEKYSRMDAQMTEVRQEITRIQQEIQIRNANTEKLLEERQEMILETKRISEESKILREDEKRAKERLQAIRQEVLQSKRSKEEAQRNVNLLEQQSKEYRRRFFESSLAFRKECKKRKLTCQKLGLIHEPLVAHAAVFRPQMLSSSLENHVGSLDESPKSHEQVEERNRMVAQLKALEASHAESKRRRDKLEKEKQELLNRSRDRNQRKANLQSQLERIMKDIESLQNQLQSKNSAPPIREETTQTQALPNASCRSRSTTAGEYQNRRIAMDLLKYFVTYILSSKGNGGLGAQSSGAIVRNPYAKSNQKKPRQPSVSSRRETTNSPKEKNTGSATTSEQYPHRAAGARRRAPQDFGLSLRIQHGTDSSDDDDDSKDDELLSFIAFRK